MKPRALSSKIQLLAQHFPVVVVVGARQVGKSTLLGNLFGDSHEHITFDPVQDVRGANADPDLFLRNSLPKHNNAGSDNVSGLILDEIQYAPLLVPALKRAVDADRRPGRFIVTGSQAWEVTKSISESLAGRAAVVTLRSFSVEESVGKGDSESWWVGLLKSSKPEDYLRATRSRALSPAEALWRGWYPGANALPDSIVPDFYHFYILSYIGRDVRLLAQIDDVLLFSRFYRLCGSLTGQEINLSHCGREIGVTPQTARRWLDILASTFQWIEIPAYSRNFGKRLSGKSKGYMADTGVACYTSGISGAGVVAGHMLWGPLFESMVVVDIEKALSTLSPVASLHHWRAHSGAEVDLLIESEGMIIPVEIKGKSNPTVRDARGLSAFVDAYPKLRIPFSLVVAPVHVPYKLGNTTYVVPWDPVL